MAVRSLVVLITSCCRATMLPSRTLAERNTRRTLLGCNAKGVGTVNAAEIEVRLTDFEAPPPARPRRLRSA